MKTKLIMMMVAVLMLAACGGDKKVVDDSSGTTIPGSGDNNGVVTDGTDINGNIGQPITDIWNDPRSLLSQNTIYFDFNSSQIRTQDMGILNAHAKYLADNPGARVRLEGHADERGSREYNVALSENRTMSARRLMTFQGMSAAQTEIIAYGEERPKEFAATTYLSLGAQ